MMLRINFLTLLTVGLTLTVARDTATGAESSTRPTTLPSPLVVPLWDNVPNAAIDPPPERDDGTGRIWEVSVPAMLVYLPLDAAADPKPRMAIVHCPGGGYTHLTRLVGADGLVQEFLPRGVAVIALKYRLKPPSNDVERDAADDARRAIQLVRRNAKAWNIDPKRIGLVGASAGANVALNVVSRGSATQPSTQRASTAQPSRQTPHAAPRWRDPQTGDPTVRASSDREPVAPQAHFPAARIDHTARESGRPDFVGLLSPWPNQHEASHYPISPDAPPTFIATARDDRTAPCAFAEAIAKAYESAGVPHRLWIVESGGHGAFTLGGSGEGARWPDRFWAWLGERAMNP